MRHLRIGSISTTRLALISLLWLVTGVGAGVMLDRQLLADAVPNADVPDSVMPEFKLIGEAWNMIDKVYVDRSAVKPRRMAYGAISGMVDSLGDTGHSTFLTPQELKEAHDSIEGHFAGIGAEIRMQGKHVVVVAPLDGSPALESGLRPGDVIFKVDGKDVVGQTLEQVVRKIRGPAGSKVTLTIHEPKAEHLHDVTITRAVIHVHSVTWHMLPGTKIADVRIASFSQNTTKELMKAVDELRAAGAHGIVLDLRSDPGGLLDQAVNVASLFLSGGNVLLEKDAQGKIHPVPVDDNIPTVEMPMVVLTNIGTASASEILAGALQDADRATIVGESTFGTGTVLQQFPLSDGSAVLLAVEEWLTPKGHTIWHKGIKPDEVVSLGQDVTPVLPLDLRRMNAKQFKARKDTQLLKAIELLQGQQA